MSASQRLRESGCTYMLMEVQNIFFEAHYTAQLAGGGKYLLQMLPKGLPNSIEEKKACR